MRQRRVSHLSITPHIIPATGGRERQSPAAAGLVLQTLLRFAEVTAPSAGGWIRAQPLCLSPITHLQMRKRDPPVAWRGRQAPAHPGAAVGFGDGAAAVPPAGPAEGSPHTPQRRPDGIKNRELPPTGTLCHEAHLGHQRPQAAAGKGVGGEVLGKVSVQL